MSTRRRIEPFRTITAFEHHDSERTHRFITGPVPLGPVDVHVREAPGRYPGPYNVVTRQRDELFVLFGVYPEVDGADGAQVVSLDAGTLEERWRTRLLDCRASDRWNYMGVIGVLPDGDLIAMAGNQAFRLDPGSGSITAQVGLPVNGPVRDAAYNGYTMLSDGCLAAKTVHRHGTEVDGFAAFFHGDRAAVPVSTVVVLDPVDWSVVAALDCPEHIGGRITSTMLDGRDVVYLVGNDELHRMVWDGEALTIDPSWKRVTVRRGRQTASPANAVVGGYTVLQTNAVPSPEAMSLHCIDQRNSERHVCIEPFAEYGAPVSFLPAMLSVDPENRRVYSHDTAAARLACFDIGASGELERRWTVEQRSLSFTTLIGPDGDRIIVGTDIPGLTDLRDLMTRTGEQVVWRSASTGDERARTPMLPVMSPGVLVTPGFDGRLYMLGHAGTITELSLSARKTDPVEELH
jgi:hypothetical protein